MARIAVALFVVVAMLGGSFEVLAASPAEAVKLALPATAEPDRTFAFEVRVPPRVAAAVARAGIGLR